jgi:endonuclease YncB( thermonuclease family)
MLALVGLYLGIVLPAVGFLCPADARQSCTTGGKIWQCWAAAICDLRTLLDQRRVTCEAVGEPHVYERLLTRCSINGESLFGVLVREGYAVARSGKTTDCVAAEGSAREEKVGLWQGEFRMAEAF